MTTTLLIRLWMIKRERDFSILISVNNSYWYRHGIWKKTSKSYSCLNCKMLHRFLP